MHKLEQTNEGQIEAAGVEGVAVGAQDGAVAWPGAGAAERAGAQAPGLPLGILRRLGSRSGWLLAVCCVSQFMVILDLSIVNVALPHIQAALNFSSTELLWVVDAYTIAFAGFLMLAGRVADRYGQRRTFVAALILFGVTSLVGGLAQDRTMLTVARGLQGLAGAFMAASSLAIIISSFPAGPKLHRAIGLWAAMNGLGGAAGTLFGGIITQFLTWRWVLLINPPIGIVTALVAFVVVRERRRAQGRHNFDLAGALTLTIGQMLIVYGVVEAGLVKWSAAAALGPIIGGAALLVLFGVIEARLASAPLIPFKELTRPLKVANNIVLLFSTALFPMWFVSTFYLQQVLGLSPLNAGLTFLPMTLMIAVVARQAGKLVGRFGVRAVLGSGLLMMTVGLLLFTNIEPSGSPVIYVIIPGLLTTAGIALSIVPSTIAATQGAKEGQAGLASGLVNTSRQIGGGLGLAVLITLATQQSTHLIGQGHGALEALTGGFRLAYLLAAGLAAAAALVTFAFVPGRAAAEAAHAGGRGAPSQAGGAPATPPGGSVWRRALRARSPLALVVAGVLAAFIALDLSLAGSRGAPIGEYTKRNAYSFVSAPRLHPPKVTPAKGAETVRGPLQPGLIFLTSFYDLNEAPMVGQSGPLILDNHLQPVWFQPVPEKVVAANLSVQSYEGRPVLAWWQGVVTNTGAIESGEYVIVNQHYQTIARLRGQDGWKLTLHAFTISGHDAWVSANKDIPADLSAYGGAYNGAMTDVAVQEYDLKTGGLVRSWDALQHIPPSQSYATVPTNGFPWDTYHINAIQMVGDGTFLVSMRNTWAVYLVNIKTGGIEWTVGGKHSSFAFGRGAQFQWQHDAELHPGGVLTMFDDHCCQLTGGGTSVHATAPSRGLVLRLDPAAHRASLLAQYTGGGQFESEYMGDTQLLSNGNVFVGWGSERWFSEYTRSGKLLMEGELPKPDQTYRAIIDRWVGLPLSAPAGAARVVGDGTTVYASWNGATQVASWRVLAPAGPRGRAAVVASAPRAGFETAIPVGSGHATYEVQALSASGRVLGTSGPFGVRG
jgi:EmrB/QacA subfamily drug resistance transporter